MTEEAIMLIAEHPVLAEIHDDLQDQINQLPTITCDGKKVRELKFHFSGEDGEFMWMEFVMDDGSNHQSFYFKGTI